MGSLYLFVTFLIGFGISDRVPLRKKIIPRSKRSYFTEIQLFVGRQLRGGGSNCLLTIPDTIRALKIKRWLLAAILSNKNIYIYIYIKFSNKITKCRLQRSSSPQARQGPRCYCYSIVWYLLLCCSHVIIIIYMDQRQLHIIN